jgi:hypothetical protein
MTDPAVVARYQPILSASPLTRIDPLVLVRSGPPKDQRFASRFCHAR